MYKNLKALSYQLRKLYNLRLQGAGEDHVSAAYESIANIMDISNIMDMLNVQLNFPRGRLDLCLLRSLKCVKRKLYFQLVLNTTDLEGIRTGNGTEFFLDKNFIFDLKLDVRFPLRLSIKCRNPAYRNNPKFFKPLMDFIHDTYVLAVMRK